MMLGSVTCQECECYVNGDFYDTWIVCTDIIHAISKNKLKFLRKNKLEKLNKLK